MFVIELWFAFAWSMITQKYKMWHNGRAINYLESFPPLIGQHLWDQSSYLINGLLPFTEFLLRFWSIWVLPYFPLWVHWLSQISSCPKINILASTKVIASENIDSKSLFRIYIVKKALRLSFITSSSFLDLGLWPTQI